MVGEETSQLMHPAVAVGQHAQPLAVESPRWISGQARWQAAGFPHLISALAGQPVLGEVAPACAQPPGVAALPGQAVAEWGPPAGLIAFCGAVARASSLLGQAAGEAELRTSAGWMVFSLAVAVASVLRSGAAVVAVGWKLLADWRAFSLATEMALALRDQGAAVAGWMAAFRARAEVWLGRRSS